MTDILDHEAHELAAMIAAGTLTPSELMQATLARIAEVNPTLNAVVSLRPEDELMAEARTLGPAAPSRPLHGLPIAIKDLADAEGLPTSRGSPIFAGQVAAADEPMVARLRAAGAIVIGKTNTPEFGLGSHTFNPVHGVTGNAYDPALSAGGSSGGAAVALAARILPIADGSDMMGSLRNPAGWNNVYGFRPSYGLVPDAAEGDAFLHQLATLGPMGRSPRDIALQLGVMGGGAAHDPHALPLPAGLDDLDRIVRGLRIGWLGDWGGAYPMETGVLETCEAALRGFADLGMEVEPVAAPFPAEAIWESWITLRSWAVAASLAPLYETPQTRAQLKPAAIWEVERGLALSAMEVHRASVLRSDWFRRAVQLFDRYDALVLPTAQLWPFPKDQVHPTAIAGREMDTYHRWMEVVLPVSLLGLPCLAVPAGFGAQGLPMGLQLFGRRGADVALLRLGQAWHRASGWPSRRPPGS